MSETPKHTPGPWEVDVTVYEHMAAGIRQVGGKRAPIAQVWRQASAYPNACVIAAAPTMLAALKDLLVAINEQPNVRNSLEIQLPQAVAAIAEAEGRS